MRNITIAGNVGQDSTIRQTQTGKSVLGFSVAVKAGWGENEHTIWFNCSMWGVRGERLSSYIKKGTSVCVSGSFDTREYEGKTYMEIEVSEVTLQGQAKSQEGGQNNNQGSGVSGNSDYQDDEIPF